MDRDAKVSTETPSSDLPLRGQRSKFEIISNGKNDVYLLDMDMTYKTVHGDLVV